MRGRITYTLAAISLAVALPLCIILVASFANHYESRLEVAEQERIGYARLSALAFRSLVEDAGRALELLGDQSDELRRDRVGGTVRMDAVADQFPADYVALVDLSGSVLAASDRGLLGSSFASSPAFVQALVSETGLGIEPSSASKRWGTGLHIARRVHDSEGNPAGVMMMRIDVDRLHDKFPVVVSTGGISIIDSKGQVIFQNESPAFARERARWGDRYPFVRDALDGQVAPTRNFRFPSGERRIGAFVPIEPFGWAAGSSVDASAPFKDFWRSVRIMLPLAVLVSVLGLAVAAGISLGIRTSLVALAAGARRIGDGDFDTPVVVSRDDEIGEVANSLERARQDLKRYAQENARLYDAEHDVAEKLQSALLNLPSRVDGVEYAVRYLSATDTVRVGGDFYDVFPLDEGRVGITIGDLAGHGIDAAVLTSLVRTAIRVRASEPDPSPSDVLASANQVLYGGSTAEKFATVLFGILDTGTGRLRFSSGGHPAAAIIGSGGVRPLPANSPIVGGFPHVSFGLSHAQVDPGELIFLYTDGLIEARADGELYGEDRLFDLLAGLDGLSPEQVARDVFEDVSSFTGGDFRDDVAILVVRRTTS